MSVIPKLTSVIAAPPEPIEVHLRSDEPAPTVVSVSLTVSGTPRACRISDSAASTSGLSMVTHRLPVGSEGGSVYYLHDWGPATIGALIVVRVDHGDASTTVRAQVVT